MRDVNADLKLALKELLQDIDYPVYNNFVPASENGNAYVLISSVTSNDISTMNSADTDTDVQIGIYTRDSIHVGDSICDIIAGQVYERIYPTTGHTIALPNGFQNYGISLIGDNPAVLNLNSFIFINRILTFNFKIKH